MTGTVARTPGFGETQPAVSGRTSDRPIRLASLAGRELNLVFVGGLATDERRRAMCRAAIRAADTDGPLLMFVSPDTADPPAACLLEPGLAGRVLLDADGAVSQAFGVGQQAGETATVVRMDRALRVVERRSAASLDELRALLDGWRGGPVERSPAVLLGSRPPVLMIDKIFEPPFAAALVRHFDREGGVESGFMVRDGEMTRGRLDRRIKRRRDVYVRDPMLAEQCQKRIHYRLCPAISAAFQFDATRIERYLVARYDAEDRGTFLPHRDNDTSGTAHRRFAVSVNLTDDYEGGCLRFPEFGDDLYRPPAGSALVFSCSLLHEATPVTAGSRYVFLTFLFGEQDVATVRQNRSLVVDDGRGALAGDPPG